jgi:hypothetical protein
MIRLGLRAAIFGECNDPNAVAAERAVQRLAELRSIVSTNSIHEAYHQHRHRNPNNLPKARSAAIALVGAYGSRQECCRIECSLEASPPSTAG